MAKFSAWLLLSLCGGSIAKEGPFVPDSLSSSSVLSLAPSSLHSLPTQQPVSPNVLNVFVVRSACKAKPPKTQTPSPSASTPLSPVGSATPSVHATAPAGSIPASGIVPTGNVTPSLSTPGTDATQTPLLSTSLATTPLTPSGVAVSSPATTPSTVVDSTTGSHETSFASTSGSDESTGASYLSSQPVPSPTLDSTQSFSISTPAAFTPGTHGTFSEGSTYVYVSSETTPDSTPVSPIETPALSTPKISPTASQDSDNGSSSPSTPDYTPVDGTTLTEYSSATATVVSASGISLTPVQDSSAQVSSSQASSTQVSFSEAISIQASSTQASRESQPSSQSDTVATTSASSTNNHLVLTVATDGSGDFTAINEAIKTAQASGYPTVSVLAGTYTENIVIAATPTVTIVGQVSNKRDYTSNQVVVDNGQNALPALSYNVANAAGVTWKNMKFANSNVTGTAGAVSLRGSKNAFYNCQLVSANIAALTGTWSSAIIANSYIEAADKVIYNYPSLYIYGSTVTATKSNALLVYNKGGLSGGTMYNATVVFDTSAVVQKSGTTNSKVYLAAGNGDGSVVVYRDSSIAGFIAASGVYVDAKTQSTKNTYIEFGTTGDGSYQNHVTDRSKYVSWVTDVNALSHYEVSTFFASTLPDVAVSNVDWIDPDVLAAIRASNAKDSPATSTSVASTSISASSDTSSSAVETTSVSSASSTVASSGSTLVTSSASIQTSSSSASSESSGTSTLSASSVASSAACSLPSSFPSTALVVGPSDSSCAAYNTIASAIAALPADSTTQYIYILAGTYNEKLAISRVGSTIIRGETSNSLSWKNNKVTISATNAVLSSAGGSSSTATFSASKYEANLVSLYNINLENSYDATTNYVALAVYAKGKKVAFYGCNIISSQGTLYFDYGNFFVSNSRIEGTTDFVWGQGNAYIYNSLIVSDGTTTGQAIAANKFQNSYGQSQSVFDLCAVVPSSNSVPEAGTYLGRDYSTKATVAFVNSFLDGHIAPAGWKINTPSTFAGTFVEGNNTGPGYVASSRSSLATIKSDTSSYNAAAILGDDTWLDKTAIAPFAGWPDSVYKVVTTTTSATSSSTSISESSTAAATTTAAASSTFTVSPSPTGDEYATVASALAAVPNDGEDYTIYVKAGSYNEQLSLTRTAGKITIRGETSFENDFTQNQVLIWFKLGYSTSASRNEETPVINWKNTQGAGLSLYNVNFTNTYPQTSSTAALAADFFGTNMAAYGCAFKGFQDTLLVNQGVQVFSNCYVEGSVDFIWGYSKAYFHQSYIASNTPNAYITAQNRKTATSDGGFIFDKCLVTYTSSYGTSYQSTYLGRPWSANAIVVYMNSYLDKHIAPAGWSIWSTSAPQTSNVLFGEFNNTGPGNWTSDRASFATKLSESQASQYSLGTFIGSTSWLDMKAYSYTPSYTITASTTSSSTTPSESASGLSWPSHPSSGTTPPDGAVLVSVDGAEKDSFSSLTDALDSLPDDSTSQVIFVYPGTYTEQVPSINRPGPVTIIGYTESSPGSTYKSNKVTVTQAKGLSVSGTIPAGRSNADTATIATASNKIAFYNIEFINTDNLDGSTASYVALAASVYGDKIGFYGCSFIGWQDTLLNGATAGYQYYESCYIEGAIDFIWGYSKAYFKGCTLAAKRAKSAITAQSRKSSSAIGGYIFDQCLFTEAASATVDLEGQVYLGRPYSAYALVVVKNSYLDSTIQPAGWKVWSATDPRTDYVTFAEYANDGPGKWESNTAAREAFGYATLLTSDEYPLKTVMDSTDWIDLTFWDSIDTPTPTTITPEPSTTTPTVYDGTTPPAGAYIVSKSTIEGVTIYDTVQAAIDALPASSKVTPTVFIYPGTYEEQIVLSRAGTTLFIGYSDSPDDYSKNQVTITYNKGIDTQAQASNSDSATFYAAGNYFQASNINFANTFGTASNYASLGFGVKSSKYASLYGCQVYGNQDALLINGFFFASNSYIEGNIDMIWGSGAGYFLDSDISPNKDKVSITANKRTDGTTAAGFVFDQCKITAANSASFSNVNLGRPWNQYARVAYIDSYLDSCINAAGWDDWTSSDPRTDNVLFGEYENSGPGSSVSGRASFATQLSGTDAAQFELANFFASTTWINMTLVSGTPFVASNVPTSTPTYTTVYTTQTITSSQTLSSTITGPIVTITQKSTTLLDVGTTISVDPVTQTTVLKSTTTQTQQITGANELVTAKVTQTTDVGATITPDPETVTSTNLEKTTVTSWATTKGKASTITITTTGATSTPKSVTTVVTIATTLVGSKLITPAASTVVSTTTVTSGTGGTKTTSLKATTVYSTASTTSTKTVKKTTTLSCIPIQQQKRDLGPLPSLAAVQFGVSDFDLNAGLTRRGPVKRDGEVHDLLEARAAALSTVSVTVTSTFVKNVKTSTVTLPGSTTTVESITTKVTGKTTTLKPTTVLETTVSLATKYSTITLAGTTSTTTLTSTRTTGKTTTLKPETTTVTVGGTSVVTVKGTSTLPAETSTAYKTATTVLAPVTVTKTTVNTVKATSTSTLERSTTTKWATVKTTLLPSETVTLRSTVSKTTTSVAKTTVTSWATVTKKAAKTCAA